MPFCHRAALRACRRAWTLRAGDAPNEPSDELVIDLAWDIVEGDRAGTAVEQLRIEL